MEEIKKEETKLSKRDKLMIGGGMLLAALVGFKVGDKYTCFRVNRGIEKCWAEDPTLKDHMWDVIHKVQKNM